VKIINRGYLFTLNFELFAEINKIYENFMLFGKQGHTRGDVYMPEKYACRTKEAFPNVQKLQFLFLWKRKIRKQMEETKRFLQFFSTDFLKTNNILAVLQKLRRGIKFLCQMREIFARQKIKTRKLLKAIDFFYSTAIKAALNWAKTAFFDEKLALSESLIVIN